MSPERESLSSQLVEYVRWCATHRTSPRVAEFATRLGKSRSSITTRFARESPCNVGAALRIAQIEFAKELLHDTNLPLSKVAEMTGFSSERSFYRAFIRITGEKPGCYRRHAKC